MPIYEYECSRCNRQFQSLIMNREDEKHLLCPGCGCSDLKRLISRVVYHVSEQDRIDAYDPSASQSESFYKDTRNIGLHAKKRAQQMGVDLGSTFEEKLDRLRTDPTSLLKDGE